MGHLHLPHPVGAARTHSPVREQRRIRPSTARDTAHSRSHVTAQLPSATGSSVRRGGAPSSPRRGSAARAAGWRRYQPPVLQLVQSAAFAGVAYQAHVFAFASAGRARILDLSGETVPGQSRQGHRGLGGQHPRGLRRRHSSCPLRFHRFPSVSCGQDVDHPGPPVSKRPRYLGQPNSFSPAFSIWVVREKMRPRARRRTARELHVGSARVARPAVGV
eukprot:CAMPEP_0198681146 /NCGR_PEP_ID=MMETSP1468-20131203/6247_1 /TAXON_ID=1461545 /ORGANISM="Mantoniella sp, Strain CCMP1436" /LENGTH=217 /DNA_ID=CAMNT_0044422461 /DNA_START=152 /DNA_END=802 /DNA_ORIENTATION=+